MPKGGPCVTSTSISLGMVLHNFQLQLYGYMNPHQQNQIEYGDPNILIPSTSIIQCSSFLTYTSLSNGWYLCILFFNFYQQDFLSSAKSWLPAMTILCLQGKFFKNCLNRYSSSLRDKRVKSPAWMKISALGKSYICILWCRSWVSDMATIVTQSGCQVWDCIT